MTSAPPPAAGPPAPGAPPTGWAPPPLPRHRGGTVRARVVLVLMVLAFLAGTAPFLFLRWISGDTDAAAIPADVCDAVETATGFPSDASFLDVDGDHRKRATCSVYGGIGDRPAVDVQLYRLGDVDSSSASLEGAYLGSLFCDGATVGDGQPNPSPEISELGGLYSCPRSRQSGDAVTVAVGGQWAKDESVFCTVVYTRDGGDRQAAFASARRVVQEVFAKL